MLHSCEIVAVLRTYIELCRRSGANCGEPELDWATSSAEHLVSTGKCPDGKSRAVDDEPAGELAGFWAVVLTILFELLQELIAELSGD